MHQLISQKNPKELMELKKLCILGYFNSGLLLVLQAASSSIAVGSHVYAPDSEDAWIEGEVLGVSGEDLTIKCTNGKQVCNFSHACIRIHVV